MSYRQIELEYETVPEPIRAFIARRVDPFLCDVRWMLTAPSDPDGPALNLSIAVILSTVIGGLSRVFYNDDPSDNGAFKKTAARYPFQDEPTGAIDPATFPDLLYDVYRNGLIHSSGIHVDRVRRQDPWSFKASDERYVVARWRQGTPRTEAELEALDSPVRIEQLPATLERVDGKVRLVVDALYWGVRKLVTTLATDQALHGVAVGFLSPWIETQRSGRGFEFGAAMSSGSVAVVYGPTWTAVDSTAGAMSSLDTRLNDK